MLVMLLLLVLVLVCPCQASTFIESKRATIDLSNLPHLPSATLAGVLQDEISEIVLRHDSDDTAVVAVVNVDLTSSGLKDEGFQQLVDALVSSSSSSAAAQQPHGNPVHLKLKSRRNQLSSDGAKYLIDKLLLLSSTSVALSSVAAAGGSNSNGTVNAAKDDSTTTSAIQNATSEREAAHVVVGTEESTTSVDEEEDEGGGAANQTLEQQVQNNAQEPIDEEQATLRPISQPAFVLSHLDLGFNHLQPREAKQQPRKSLQLEEDELRMVQRRKTSKKKKRKAKKETLEDSMERLIASVEACPSELCLTRCSVAPSLCRAIAKGLMQRHGILQESKRKKKTKQAPAASSSEGGDSVPKPLSLFLSGNAAIGDVGCAALAAALKTIVQEGKADDESLLLLDKLDLSACGVSDAGAEALALALESCAASGQKKVIVRDLDLSNNHISDQGAARLARALLPQNGLDRLDLSHNKDIGDATAEELASAMEQGRLANLALRSCHVQARGASAFGTMLLQAKAPPAGGDDNRNSDAVYELDLSGNPLGVLRGKSKSSGGGGGKYSASRLKSTAGATAASYMNQGMSFLKKGLKDVGMDVSPLFGSTLESDDEEDEEDEQDSADKKAAGFVGGDVSDPSKAQCGIQAMVRAYLQQDDDENGEEESASKGVQKDNRFRRRFHLGLRRCFLDHKAADALAALLVEANGEGRHLLTLDVGMNPVLEDEMVRALHQEGDDDKLQDMAEAHQSAMETLRLARQRARRASEAVQARMETQRRRHDDFWDDDDDDPFGQRGGMASSRRGRETPPAPRRLSTVRELDEVEDSDDEYHWDATSMPPTWEDDHGGENEWDSDADYEQDEDEDNDY